MTDKKWQVLFAENGCLACR